MSYSQTVHLIVFSFDSVTMASFVAPSTASKVDVLLLKTVARAKKGGSSFKLLTEDDCSHLSTAELELFESRVSKYLEEKVLDFDSLEAATLAGAGPGEKAAGAAAELAAISLEMKKSLVPKSGVPKSKQARLGELAGMKDEMARREEARREANIMEFLGLGDSVPSASAQTSVLTVMSSLPAREDRVCVCVCVCACVCLCYIYTPGFDYKNCHVCA